MGRTSDNAAEHAVSGSWKWHGYAVALLAVAGGLLLRWALSPLLGQQGPYLILTLSIVLAGLYGGFGPALAATALGAMVGTYLFIGAKPGWEHVLELANITRILLFVAIGASISVISGRLQASRRALAGTVEELRKRNLAKDHVLAMVAHEIRSPLSALAAANQVLERSVTDPSRVTWASEIVGRQVRQIGRMADDLMDASKVLHGGIDMQMEALDLRTVLRQALEQSNAAIVAKQHRLASTIPDAPAAVRGDAGRLVQVFANLLTNAAKYTPPGGSIDLALAPVDAGWEVGVADNGQGFDPGMQDALFEPFVQAPAAAANQEAGLGLGLAIVQRIVELHGGHVRAHSPGQGQGATFVVRLPSQG